MQIRHLKAVMCKRLAGLVELKLLAIRKKRSKYKNVQKRISYKK